MIDKIKQFSDEIMQPVFDQIIDTCCVMFENIAHNLPADMPESEKDKIIKQLLDTQAKSMVAAMKGVVPVDLANKLKEAANGK